MACVWRRSCLATAGGGGTVRAVRASRASKGGPTPTWPLSAKPTSAADEVHGRRIAQLQSPSPPATVVDVAAPLSPTPATPLPPSPLPPSPLLIILLLFDIFFSFRVEFLFLPHLSQRRSSSNASGVATFPLLPFSHFFLVV